MQDGFDFMTDSEIANLETKITEAQAQIQSYEASIKDFEKNIYSMHSTVEELSSLTLFQKTWNLLVFGKLKKNRSAECERLGFLISGVRLDVERLQRKIKETNIRIGQDKRRIVELLAAMDLEEARRIKEEQRQKELERERVQEQLNRERIKEEERAKALQEREEQELRTSKARDVYRELSYILPFRMDKTEKINQFQKKLSSFKTQLVFATHETVQEYSAKKEMQNFPKLCIDYSSEAQIWKNFKTLSDLKISNLLDSYPVGFDKIKNDFEELESEIISKSTELSYAYDAFFPLSKNNSAASSYSERLLKSVQRNVSPFLGSYEERTLTSRIKELVSTEKKLSKATEEFEKVKVFINQETQKQREFSANLHGSKNNSYEKYVRDLLIIANLNRGFFDNLSRLKSVRSNDGIILAEIEVACLKDVILHNGFFKNGNYKVISDRDSEKIKDRWLKAIQLRYAYLLYLFDEDNFYPTKAVNLCTHWIDSSVGKKMSGIIGSLTTTNEELKLLDFSLLEPVDCFRYFKGVSAPSVSEPNAVRPIISFDLKDKRLIKTKDIVSDLENTQNLATIPWEDFEHLVVQVLSNEFHGKDVEIRTTRASRDQGVDAVIFDPNLITGGKIIIQAKRYNSTVDAAAVRELYGTILNEGANRGILITTSSYGKASYSFAKDRPITLIDGQMLLQLLQKQGHDYRIDLVESNRH